MATATDISDFRRRFRRWMVTIGCIHVALTGAVFTSLVAANSPIGESFTNFSVGKTLTNACLFGFLGSLLYFSRKCYIYLITDKFNQILTASKNDDDPKEILSEILQTRLVGYYLYLATRPIAGLVVGPLIVMFIFGGLLTLGSSNQTEGIAVSATGTFVIYVSSFLAGYSCSDLFDYLSKLGSKLIKRIDIE